MAEHDEIIRMLFRTEGAQAAKKELDAIARSKALDKVAADAAKANVSGEKLRSTAIRLRGELAKLGASDKEVAKVVRQYDRLSVSIRKAAQEEQRRAATQGGGTFGRGGTLSRIGQEVRALPAVQLPGLPFSTDVIGKLTATIGSLGPAAVVGGLAVGALTIAIGAAADATNKLNEETQRRINIEEEVTRFLANATKEQARLRQEELRRQLDVELTILREREQEYFGQLNDLNPLDQLRTAAGLAYGEIAGLGEQYTEQQKLVQGLHDEYVELSGALHNNATAANDAAAAEAALARARDEAINKAVDNQVKLLSNISNFTSDSLDSRVQSLRDEKVALEAALEAGTATNELLDTYRQRLVEINGDLSTLNMLIRPIVEAREAENQALKDQQRTLEETAAATKKYQEALQQNTDQSIEARLAAEERYLDQVVKIAERAADAAADALRKLEQQRAKLALELSRDEADAEIERQRDLLDIQIKAARDAEKAARSHAADLRRIQREANRDATQAIQDRDAVALQAAQDNRRQQVQDLNDNYAEQERERQIALRQELQDQRTQYQREREDRMREYQRDLADAQAQYQRELALAEQQRQEALVKAQAAYQRELQLIAQKQQQQEQILMQGYQRELRLASLTTQQRQQLVQHELDYLNRVAAQMRSAAVYGTGGSGSGGGSTTAPIFARRAFGGPLSAGQSAFVNERPGQRESFTSGGRTILFPPGAGVFTPTRAGMVNANGGSVVNVNIALDGKTMRAASRQEALAVFDDILTKAGVG